MTEGPTAARWLTWAAIVLLVAGVVSAGVVGSHNAGSDADVVNAAGGDADTVEPTSSTTTSVTSTQPAVTPAPQPTVARATTVPKAAAAVLAAIGTTAPPATRPPPATTTTTGSAAVSPSPTPTTATTSTTSTTVPPARVAFVNQHPNAVQVSVNRETLDLAVDEAKGPVDLVVAADGRATLEVRVVGSTCQPTKVPGVFQPGSSYRLGVVAGPVGCGGFPEPGLSFLP